jgi:hypothetical protein
MRTYIDISFNSGGVTPTMVIERVQKLTEVRFILGDHDIAFDWRTVAEFRQRMNAIHAAFAGTGVTYRAHTLADESDLQGQLTWPPLGGSANDENPAYPANKAGPGSENRER